MVMIFATIITFRRRFDHYTVRRDLGDNALDPLYTLLQRSYQHI